MNVLAYLIPISVPKGQRSASLELVEQTPSRTTISLMDSRALPMLERFLAAGELSPGFAIDVGVALCFEDGELRQSVAQAPGLGAWRVSARVFWPGVITVRRSRSGRRSSGRPSLRRCWSVSSG